MQSYIENTKIALIGYGKMNRLIEQLAKDYSCKITAVINSSSTEKDWQQINSCDVLIDFSKADAVINNITKACDHQKPIVIGTTGWDDINSAKMLVKKHNIGLIYSPNFSIGIKLFVKIVKYASSLLTDYDTALFEEHHKNKLDAPSGTAKQLLTYLPNNTNITSLRYGFSTGKHSILFDSMQDHIELTHNSKNRNGFAIGAITAAKWIINKQGFYSFEDI